VAANGRITPQDSGLWSDEQIEPLQKVVEFAHSQNQKMAIQLFHAGRRASTVAPWLHAGLSASRREGGWPDEVVAPSAIQYDELFPKPSELSVQQIKDYVVASAEAARRAVKAGIDVIEIHGAHGFLVYQFMSPQTNQRTDEYGGSFENRIRFALEVIDATRAVIPAGMPLFFRYVFSEHSTCTWRPDIVHLCSISATEGLEEVFPNEPSWTIADTVRFAPILATHGVDLIDVSSGGNSPLQKIAWHTLIQTKFAHTIRTSVAENNITVAGTGAPLLVSAVGGIKTGALANEVLENGSADVVMSGRWFQQNPSLVWDMARELDVEIHTAHQIEWVFSGRGAMNARAEKRPKNKTT
jgi:2,4-dienoyl-CoA reductase-like NADH-dependent reductase (Old Yellow Enzyme family)